MSLPGRLRLKTYSHLAQSRTVPSEYTITTTDLLFTATKGHSVVTPVTEWQKKYVDGSLLMTKDVPFQDPESYTYTKYVTVRNKKEIFLEGIYSAIEQSTYRDSLSDDWRLKVQRCLGAFVYICHGMQMASAYLGQMGSSGQLIAMLAMQTADELRRTENLVHQLLILNPRTDEALTEGTNTWMTDPAFQKVRSTLENLLVTYDWGEAYVAFNLVFKPLMDEMFLKEFAVEAAANADPLLEKILLSLAEDSDWHRLCAKTYTANVLKQDPKNSDAINKWIAMWKPLIKEMIAELSPALYESQTKSQTLESFLNSWLESLQTTPKEQTWSTAQTL